MSAAPLTGSVLVFLKYPAPGAVKTRLAANRRTHPLFDMARFTEALEKAFTRAAG